MVPLLEGQKKSPLSFLIWLYIIKATILPVHQQTLCCLVQRYLVALVVLIQLVPK